MFATQNFYPDLVAKLTNGGLLLIEPKGRVDETDLEKERIGLKFAEASEGRVRFVMVRQNHPQGLTPEQQIKTALQ